MHGLRISETKRDTEKPANWDDFGFGVKKESNVMNAACLEFLSRLLTCKLTIRLRIT